LSPALTTRQPLRNKPNASRKQSLAPHRIHDNSKCDPDLIEIMDAWSRLPDAIRKCIVAIVRASIKTSG
jgi:hypothetical protein